MKSTGRRIAIQYAILAGAVFSALSVSPLTALAAPIPHVLIVRGESPDLRGGGTVTGAIESSSRFATAPLLFGLIDRWERQRLTILIAGLVLIIETVLVVALVRLARRRRDTQRLLEARLYFGRLLSELSLSLTAAAPDEIDGTLDASLRRIAAGVPIEWVWRWEFGNPRDGKWDSPPLRAGEPAYFGVPAALPLTIQDHLRQDGITDGASVAVPLAAGGVVVGAIFWARDAGCPLDVDELQMVANAVATVLQRKRAERALEQSDRLKGAILASLPAQVAVLDRQGTIIAVNGAWQEFGRANGIASDAAIGPGQSYRRACMGGVSAGDPTAIEALHLIESVCAGARVDTQIEYRCDAPGVERWFLMTAEPLRRAEGGAVVTHSDITERKMSEIALRESDGRFWRMADALPVPIWMTGVDAQCTYLNRHWLQLTGRRLDQEIGAGWVDGIHEGDRAEAMTAYLDAFHARRSFRIEYRIRRWDGEYRWLLDSGMPRYGSDGSFHGYVGGCIDITERREAEQLFRDLNRRLIVAQEDERRRIARELHDHLNQQLALLAIDLQQLSVHPPATAEGLAAALHADWRRTTEIASDVHAISHRLHPSKLEALGLVATIRAHCRDVSRQGFAVHFSERNVPGGVSTDAALCLFRVLEEAVTNASRHSGAGSADVALEGHGTDILLRVSDRGRGLTASERSSGLGLISMRERLQLVGGTLSITSSEGGGTTVEAHVPRACRLHALEEGVIVAQHPRAAGTT